MNKETRREQLLGAARERASELGLTLLDEDLQTFEDEVGRVWVSGTYAVEHGYTQHDLKIYEGSVRVGPSWRVGMPDVNLYSLDYLAEKKAHKTSLPHANSEGFIQTEQGATYAIFNYFLSRYATSHKEITRLIKKYNIPSIQCTTSAHRELKAYDVQALEQALAAEGISTGEDAEELPFLEGDGTVVIEGKKYVTVKVFVKYFQDTYPEARRSSGSIRQMIEGLPTRKARNPKVQSKQTLVVYDWEEGVQKLAEYANLPFLAESGTVAIDEVEYATIDWAYRHFGNAYRQELVRQAVAQIKAGEKRLALSGKVTLDTIVTVYPLSSVREAFARVGLPEKEVVRQPKQNQENALMDKLKAIAAKYGLVPERKPIYIDADGVQWVPASYAAGSDLNYGVRSNKATTRPGPSWAKPRKIINLYRLDELQAAVDVLRALPYVNDYGEASLEGRDFVTVSWVRNNIQVSNKQLNALIAGLATQDLRVFDNQTCIGYDKQAVLSAAETAGLKTREQRLALQKVGEDNSVEIAGKTYIVISELLRRYADYDPPASYDLLGAILEDSYEAEALDSIDKLVRVVELEYAEQKLREHYALPIIGRDGQCVSTTGVRLITKGGLYKAFRFRDDLQNGLEELFNQVAVFPERFSRGRRQHSHHRDELCELDFALQTLVEHGFALKQHRDMEAIRREQEAQIQVEQLQIELEQFLQSQQSEELVRLVHVFGPSKVVSLLFKLHPKFSAIPVEKVGRIIGEYLGDTLLMRSLAFLEEVPTVEGILSGSPDFEQALYVNLKEYCLSGFADRAASLGDMTPVMLVAQRLMQLEQSIGHGSPAIQLVIRKVENYFAEVLNTKKTSPRLVDSLNGGREFPDDNQKINRVEIEHEKRVAIADRMGAGKSASAIIAKEELGIPLALVVVPGDLVARWQRYLSDEVGEDGGQIGYFKPGLAPKVFTIEGPNDVENIPSDVEYIVISHERLQPQYSHELLKLDYGMLITDEVHKLKNITEGTRARELLKLAGSGSNKEVRDFDSELSKKHAEKKDIYTVLLSGTPAPNKVQDVAVLLKLLYPERFGNVESKQLVREIIHGDITDIQALLMPKMQMKNISGEAEMPELHETVLDLELEGVEKEIYQALLDTADLQPNEKLAVLREFLINPDLLEATPGLPSAKAEQLARVLNEKLAQGRKPVVFVNDYISGVLREFNHQPESVGAQRQTLIERLQELLTVQCDIYIICPPAKGKRIESTYDTDREAVERNFDAHPGPCLLLVSGNTVDVGRDFSGGTDVYDYNETWTMAGKNQRVGRVYRPGAQDDIESYTSMVKGTIEEGIYTYIREKQKLIDKLFKGVPLTELEQQILEKDEQGDGAALELNPELAEYYLSHFQRLVKFFGATKEQGERSFTKFLARYGAEYANSYTELGSRSYQANAARVCGHIVQSLAEQQGLAQPGCVVVDQASGPQMLEKHMPQDFEGRVVSTDINPHHFSRVESQTYEVPNGRVNLKPDVVVASYKNPPFENNVDFVNFSFALHYTRFAPQRQYKIGAYPTDEEVRAIVANKEKDAEKYREYTEQFEHNFERLVVLRNTVKSLKQGGSLVLNMIHSMDFKNNGEQQRELFAQLGVELVEEFSGEVDTESGAYASKVYTLRKVSDPIELKYIKPELLDSLRFMKTGDAIRDTGRVLNSFTLRGRTIKLNLNNQDEYVYNEEQQVIALSRELIAKYGGKIETIPAEELRGIDKDGFSRIRVGKKYILLKKLKSAAGCIVIRG